jgi:hypothetical protein
LSCVGAVIGRIVVSAEGPLFRTEYLSLDGAVPEFSEDRAQAVFFESHLAADARAGVLRAIGIRAFALVSRKPMPVRDRTVDTDGMPKLRDLPPRESKAERKRARRQAVSREIAADDLRELEETEVYG